MKIGKLDKPLIYHHLEWVLMHPRFAFLMIALIAFSFTHNRILAVVLFTVFSIEIATRVVIMLHKIKTNPYRTSLHRQIDMLFLVLDIIGVASLLITIFDVQVAAENATVVRLFRAFYLMRTLRVFRYIDLQSAMYSPTYGMLISLVILLSFFSEGTMLWVIIIFFSVELILRALIIRSMKQHSSKTEQRMEWGYWWIDVVATIVMMPVMAIVPYGGALRMLRLVRLLRPWLVIIRNIRDVMHEGQYLQEINLIVLILAVMSIGGGVGAQYLIGEFDYTQDGSITAEDNTMLARIWFAFRMLTDPGNSVLYPENNVVIIISVISIVIGLFVLAFFIGIGASIVSQLMVKLRNERLNFTNHMVMIGWNSVSPYVIPQLRTIAERSFTKLKLVLLGEAKEIPQELLAEKWVSYRWGELQEIESLKRVNLGVARQAIVNAPDGLSEAESLAQNFFKLLAIRKVNPNIYLNYTTEGMATPRLDSHQHMLQVGWDSTGFFNKPTVVLSQADFRANMFKNIMIYNDFDQVMTRLMIPERTEESSLQIAEWSCELQLIDGEVMISTPDGKFQAPLLEASVQLVTRGVIILSVVDEAGLGHPLYSLKSFDYPMKITAIMGIALDQNALCDEMRYMIRHAGDNERVDCGSGLLENLHRKEKPKELNLLIMGWVGSLPLLLKRLLDEYETLNIRMIDDLTDEECTDQLSYLKRRIGSDAEEGRVNISIKRWGFADMNPLKEYSEGMDKIILSRPLHFESGSYAVITTVLSHLITIVKEAGSSPEIFPVLDDRREARLLQEELDRFDIPAEVDIIVPNEFYGAYVAHTSYHMYTSETPEVYEMQRTLRHAIDDLMGDVGQHDTMDLVTLEFDAELPSDPCQLYGMLLDRGYIWIGYRLKQPFVWSDPLQNMIRYVFPRQEDFSCLRQHKLIINPYGNPVTRRSWIDRREDIAELIVIAEDISS
ncbi:MAG: hypothetical protein ABUK11_07465 [Mariprofundaceae bacterium]